MHVPYSKIHKLMGITQIIRHISTGNTATVLHFNDTISIGLPISHIYLGGLCGGQQCPDIQYMAHTGLS